MHEVEKIEGKHGIVGRLFYDEDAMAPDDWDEPGEVWTTASTVIKGAVKFDFFSALEAELESKAFQGVYARVNCYSNRNAPVMFVVLKKEHIVKEYGKFNRWTKEKAQKLADGIAEQWSQYFDGDVYGYMVTDSEGEDLDSCWGFYGFDYAIGEMKGIILYHEQEIDKLEWKKQEYHI